MILCGDFNAEASDESINLLSERMNIAQEEDGEVKGTFNGFDTSRAPAKRIDFVFYNNYFAKGKIRTIEKHRSNGLWLSDHLPVEGILFEER